jgi:hypothetical protein
VQRVLRPDHTFRGFAGQIASGTIRVGDRITALPSGRSAEVVRIVTFDGDLAEAQAPLSVTLVLNHELDISRGDLIAAADSTPSVTRHIGAQLVWMDERPLALNRRYLLKHTSHTVPAFVTSIAHRTNIATLAHEAAETLEMNAIGAVRVELLRPIALDAYAENRGTGAFILIDAASNSTVAAGVITAVDVDTSDGEDDSIADAGPLTNAERGARWGHQGGVLALNGPAELINLVERSLFTAGVITQRINARDARMVREPELLGTLAALLAESGLLVLEVTLNESEPLVAHVRDKQVTLDGINRSAVVAGVFQLLHETEILYDTERAGL